MWPSGSGVSLPQTSSSGSQLTDMHDAWRAKGAVEFVPGSTRAQPTHSQAFSMGPRAALTASGGHHQVFMGHSLGGPVGPDGGPVPYALMGGPMMGHPRWSNHQQMSVPWSTGSVPMGRGLGTGMQSDMSWSVGASAVALAHRPPASLGTNPLGTNVLGGTTVQSSVPVASTTRPLSENEERVLPPPTMTLVVFWNLKPDYAENELGQDLFEIDFSPLKMIPVDGVSGAFFLWYPYDWFANAFVASLNGTTDVLNSTNDAVRAAKRIPGSSTWSAKDIPNDILHAAEEILDE